MSKQHLLTNPTYPTHCNKCISELISIKQVEKLRCNNLCQTIHVVWKHYVIAFVILILEYAYKNLTRW